MDNKPLVSILSPCYNVEPYLPQCIESIINQSYSNLQIVLIDDGSKDNTWSILQKYAVNDSRIEVYHQDNHGVAYTRNQLLDKIKGDYFLFIDSDDWMELDMVEFLVNRAIRERVDMVTCGMVVNDNLPKNTFSEERWTQEHVVKEFLRHQTFGGSLWNKLTNVTLLHNEPRFHRGISYGEDALFTWELIKEAKTGLIVTTRQLYHYRMNPQSISHQTFGSHKLSGHRVWKNIYNDVYSKYPQYEHITRVSYAIADMWLLYYAAIANYQQDYSILELQKNVRTNIFSIISSRRLSVGQMCFAIIISLNYKLGKFFIPKKN